jgi:phage major head subunit gpT-like protein
MAAGTYSYPGLSVTGVTEASVRELLVKFTAHAIDALQMPGEELGINWAKGLYHETPIQLGDDITKVEIDLTSLDGFKEWAGVRKFQDTTMTAVPVTARPFDRAIGWDKNKARRGIYGSFPEQGARLVQQGRLTLPRLIADIFKGGTDAKFACYDGKPFWSTTHLIDPLGKDVAANRQSNYKAGYGKFSVATFKSGRTLMRKMRGLLSEPLGYTVTDVIGPTHMEDPFEEVLDTNKVIIQNAGGTAADSNVVRGKANWRICAQLDTDPYVVANPDKHMWIMLCLNVVGVKPIEVVQTNGGVPTIEFLGEESEWCKVNKKVGVMADQEVGAAPGFYMTAIRFEET